MKRIATFVLLLLLLLLMLAACGGEAGDVSTSTAPGSDPTPPTLPPMTTTTAPTTTSTEATTTTSMIENSVDEWIVDPATTDMTPGWVLNLEIGYGEADNLLGTAPGGEGLTLGPNYGAQAPDGSWWMLDGAKLRFAHYAGDGSYLGSVPLPDEYLANDQYFQYQLPQVMADGILVATRFAGDSTQILTLADGTVAVASLPGTLFMRVGDGFSLFGFDFEGAMIEVDPAAPSVAGTEWFVTQAGGRYRITPGNGEVTVELPDAGLSMVIPIRSSIGPGTVHGSFEIATGVDGSIYLLFLGISESDESVQLAGYATISPTGVIGPMEPLIDPFTPADPGSPSHLGAPYGSSSPTVMVVGQDAVRIYRRAD